MPVTKTMLAITLKPLQNKKRPYLRLTVSFGFTVSGFTLGEVVSPTDGFVAELLSGGGIDIDLSVVSVSLFLPSWLPHDANRNTVVATAVISIFFMMPVFVF